MRSVDLRLRGPRLIRLLALAVVLMAQACMNASTLQTARVLPPKDVQIYVGGGMTQFPGAPEGVGKLLASLPYLEAGGRYGVVNSVDVGAHFTLIGTAGVDGKWQFLDSGPFALSTGLGLYYLSIDSGGDSSSSTDENGSTVTVKTSKVTSKIIDVVVPLYASMDLSSHFTLYTAPKYVLRAVMNDTATQTSHSAGGTLGFKLGDSWGLMLESTYLKSLSSTGYDALQFNGALFFSL